MNQPFYRAFEDRYRGSRETIKERLRAYTPFLQALLAQSGAGARALDLGCGRGEWLELLGEQGFAAKGIDLDEGMLAACHERGLDVELKDAVSALQAVPAGSLALVSSFHLVEHLPFELVREMIAAALRALQPGGLLILETPNPENLTVGATSFYMDPTHLHPLPPNLLSFATEHAGFLRNKVVRLQEDPRLHTDARLGLITVLEGVSPDYAVVAQKPAAEDTLAAFDAAFGKQYGIALGLLAHRYEEQGAQRHGEIHNNLARLGRENAQAAGQLAHLLQRADQHEQRFGANEHRAGLLEQRIIAAEQRADMYAQQVIAMMNSSSWRITKPWRYVGGIVRRLNAARREGRLLQALKNRARKALHRTGGFVLGNRRLKYMALYLLRFTPGLRQRLYNLMLSHDAAPAQPLLAEGGSGLSPRAARVLREMQALQARKQDAHRN
ncbi:class I SAM-dependent methyltransferase [Pseudoduganella sp.]|uniref:class I SAM-dependent methyltransferase n=1 Tax=Pseudoduganella sp. TaxID=1880898 RepID=UPI0035B39321